ncbi:serpin family protein [Sodalinema gerasimenkoae]|uniref:serpin family protein n=1 Tax=Sodalinema gerasimenkoae TaxID=2862348 RepID=UPI00135A4320|nr:serpin family protein [Sodalinema gerasimenkoae]
MIHQPMYGRLLGALLPLLMGVLAGSGIPLTRSTLRGVDQATTPRTATAATPISIRDLSEAQAELGFAVFQQLWERQGGENVLLSPLSLSMALALLHGGAEGETQRDMNQMLGVSGTRELDWAYEGLLESFQGLSGEVELAIANSIWSRQESLLRPEFIESRQQFYEAQIRPVDFRESPRVLAAIHEWISQQTQGRIAELLSSRDLDETTVAVLLNAFYFSGQWTSPFPEENTELGVFHRLDRSPVYVPMMEQRLSLVRSYGNDMFQAIELPYGESERLGMYVFVPREDIPFGAFLGQFTAENWQNWLRRFEWNEAGAIVRLPRFQVTAEVNLRESLEALGLGEVFQAGADFSGLSDDPFWVTVMRQQLYLEVTEAGTEGAAVTGIGGTRSAAISVVGDRPFVFVVRDNETGQLLFLGAIVDPSLE